MSYRTFILICLAIIKINIAAQSIKPDINLTKGKNFIYNLQLKNDIRQTINNEEAITTSSFSARISTQVGNTLPGYMNVTASFAELNYGFKNQYMDTNIIYSGSAGYKKLYNYLPNGRLIKYGKIENDYQAKGMDLENNILMFTIFCELATESLKTGDSWSTKRVDTIYNEALGGKIKMACNTKFQFSSTTKINNKLYARIIYNSMLEFTGDNLNNETSVKITGTGEKSGELLIDAVSGVINSDKGTLTLNFDKSFISSSENLNSPIYCIQNYNIKLL